MIPDDLRTALKVAKGVFKDARAVSRPPAEITAPLNEPVLPHSLFRGTRGYIEKVVFQINRSYEHTCYDACAVMIRRLVEILIVESFEKHHIVAKITNASGDFFYLGDLIALALAEPSWNLGRNTKLGLARLKTIGDQSAHSRRYNARRSYIDDVIIDLRTVSEEFLYLAGLK
jgi:hypothetical protein